MTQSHKLQLTEDQRQELKKAYGIEFDSITLALENDEKGEAKLTSIQLEDVTGGCMFCGNAAHNPW